jgi:transcriptional regulator with XRE-family HTH domain
MNKIPNKLREFREARGYTQREVATALGLKHTNKLSKWELGKGYPSVVNLLRLAKLYGVEVEGVYGITNH